ncbi:hypothetical protein X754_28065 [Mesorhizobium sp. LNJC403B00]|nr:hypothetical protein X754_28065 [Mesorhizobium sp. LNJC403B00]
MISPTPSESPAQTCGAQSALRALDLAAKLFLGLAVGLGVGFGMARLVSYLAAAG